ncbi:MAG: diadenosine tetraphosphatase [Salinisphaeraceae bacterium]|nr:diadenosine tetraphosphatase [Salinisphaeraceae bacterium]
MAVYAIGDLHGCYRPFRSLLECLDFKHSRDRLWLVGDLINRGPDSLGCLREARALGDSAITVLGNHDLSFLAAATGSAPDKNLNSSLKPILDAPDCDALIAWLLEQPLAHHDPDLGWLMVHAGVAPEWDVATTLSVAAEVEARLRSAPHDLLSRMFGDLPAQWDASLTGEPRERLIINYLTRVRMTDRSGNLLMKHKGPADFDDDQTPWFRQPRATRDTRIVFGHWSALQSVAWPEDNVWCVDTGCAWGGQLTALRLDDPEFPLIQVPSDQPVPEQLR